MFLAPQDALHASTKGASYLGGSGACSSREFLKQNTQKRCFHRFWKGSTPPGPKNQFPRQGWSSLKFSLKSKIFSEVGQFSRRKGRGGEWQ